jgi:hypothetical protein
MNVELTIRSESHIEAIACFCNRVTFEDAYLRAHGETNEEREAMAYRILEGFSDIETSLQNADW